MDAVADESDSIEMEPEDGAPTITPPKVVPITTPLLAVDVDATPATVQPDAAPDRLPAEMALAVDDSAPAPPSAAAAANLPSAAADSTLPSVPAAAPAPRSPRTARPAPPLEPFAISGVFAPAMSTPGASSPAAGPVVESAREPTTAPMIAVTPDGLPPSRFLHPPIVSPAPTESGSAAREPEAAVPVLPRYGPPLPADESTVDARGGLAPSANAVATAVAPVSSSPTLPATLPRAVSTRAPALDERPDGVRTAHARAMGGGVALPGYRHRSWWARAPLRLGRWMVLLGVGGICCLGWLMAISVNVAVGLPQIPSVVAQSILVLLPPLGIALASMLIARERWPRMSLALLLIGLGCLPALLLRPPGALTPDWLSRAPLLVPAFSAGVAVSFGWPSPLDSSPRVTAWGVGFRAAGIAALGFCLPIVGLLVFQLTATFTFASPCPGPNCYTQVLSTLFLSLVEIFGVLFAIVLALVGGALGALLRAST